MAPPSSTEPPRPARPVLRSFPPLAGHDARLLILGSMPGTASLAASRYYAHPRNGFWPIMAGILEFSATLSYEERCEQLIRHGIAVWDVLQQCTRPGSLDSNIDTASVVPNDIGCFLSAQVAVRHVFFIGSAAEQLFRRHILPGLAPARLPILQRLPSTSPAHASLGFEQKLALWRNGLKAALGSE